MSSKTSQSSPTSCSNNGKDKDASLTDVNITQAFTRIQARRKNHATTMMKKSHRNQSIQALDSFSSTLLAKYILLHANTEHGLSALLSTSRPLHDLTCSRCLQDDTTTRFTMSALLCPEKECLRAGATLRIWRLLAAYLSGGAECKATSISANKRI